MPKRTREQRDQPVGDVDEGRRGEVRVESSAQSTKKFFAFVEKWNEEVASESRPPQPPSALPPLSSVPTLVMGGAGRDSASPAPRASGTGVVMDPVMRKHRSADPGEYERPARLEVTEQHLRAVGLLGECVQLPSRRATRRELRRVHSSAHVDHVEQLDFVVSLKRSGAGGAMSVGQDLYACSDTPHAARTAAGCAVAATQAVLDGACRNAFALVRPPGHHAGADAASGFCFFNNVAVAARCAQERLSSGSSGDGPASAQRPRVAILDWDVHHCDGTETIFIDDPSVLVVSVHQYGNGRGHVLRREKATVPAPPAAAEVDLAELDALLGDATPGDAAPPVPSAAPATTEVATAAADDDSGGDGGRPRRRRPPVDYAKLAEDLDATDAAAAALFGVRDLDLSSSSSASSGSSSSSGEARRARPGGGIPGDGSAVYSSDDGRSASAGGSEAGDGGETFYPGTGHLYTVGDGAAAGRNLNLPLPAHGFGDLEYLRLLTEVVVPVLDEFAPQVVLISCGFDSARGDVLGSMELTPSGYYYMTRIVADRFGAVVAVLEGGYNVSNVAKCSEAVLRALLESGRAVDAPPLPFSRMLLCQTDRLIERVRRQHGAYWQCLRDGRE